MDRDAAENDPDRKQLIPYLVLRDAERTFLMRRTRSGTDARLHDLYSIGIGGHVGAADADIAGALRREWHEEMDAAFDPEPTAIGLLNDDTTAVGSVHLGIVFVADARGRSVAIRETDKLVGGFVSPDEVLAVVESMESWSRLIVDELVAAPEPRR
jgi:predicted NUDIX family phosphoesterase